MLSAVEVCDILYRQEPLETEELHLIYVTGDMHGDYSRFKSPDIRHLRAGDTLLVCGDFGFIWDGSKAELKRLKKIGNQKYTVAFVDGCHENYDLLERYPVEEWNGGKVHRISGNLVHLMRGEIYTVEDETFLAFGGGHSGDYEFRRETENWWEREQPSYQEILNAMENLAKYDNKIDYIISHEPPASLKDCLEVDVGQRLEVHTFFEDISKVCTFRKWYFGKCHMNKRIPLKYHALFDEVCPLTED